MGRRAPESSSPGWWMVVFIGAVAATIGAGIGARGSAAGVGVAGQEGRAGPPKALAEPARGQAAIDELGPRLDEVAAAHRMTPAGLRKRFREDRSLWVDETLRLLYIEEAIPAPAREQAAPDGSASVQQSSAFGLHSRPGSSRVIYLDFDGHTATGTGWNDNATYGTGSTVVSTPYDSDGSPGTFSAAEQAVVHSVWQRVAEDYAPFDVDVTTADPGTAAIDRSGSSDEQYGTSVVVAGSNPIYSYCSCGGAAYVGSYNDASSHAYYQPAFVFQQGLGGASASAKNIAEAASHEAGHNLGLHHDDTSTASYYSGHGPWAPIMGVGYSKPVTQWSKGEYAGSSNTEDDLRVIPTFGAPLLADDHGDTTASATALDGRGTGRIGTSTDVDVFSFTTSAGGAVTVSADPAEVSPNLDLALTLRSSSGAVLATADPPAAYSTSDVASGLAASLTQTLAAGTYFMTVDGVGVGSPASSGYSDYGSLGAYTVDTGVAVCVTVPEPIAWWRMEDDGTATAGPSLLGATSFATGHVGRGVSPTAGEAVRTESFPAVSTGLTVETWVRTARGPHTQVLVSRWRDGDNEGSFSLMLSIDGDLIWVTDETSALRPGELRAPATALFDGQFHHVAATWSGTTVSLHVDGQEIASGRSPGGQLNPAPGAELRIGSTSGPGHPGWFSGVLDEATVYGRALTESEIDAIHGAGPAGKCVP